MALAVRIAVDESRREKAPALHTRQPTRTRWDRGTVGGTTDRNDDRAPGTSEGEQLIVMGCHVCTRGIRHLRHTRGRRPALNRLGIVGRQTRKAAHGERSAERRVGKEWVSTGRSRWSPEP